MIRDICENDRKIYMDMVKEFYESEAVLHPISETNISNCFEQCLKNNPYLSCYILEYENVVCGYVLLSKTYSQEAGGMVLLIEEVYIREKFRGKGIAKQVFEFLMSKYKDYKRYRLELCKTNDRAYMLYKKIGFLDLEYMQMIKE